jgi:hypothetical protein
VAKPRVDDPPTQDAPPDAGSFEVLQALPGFCSLIKRSPTLDGQLPLRAAQHCSPVFEGNEAGYQLCLQQPMTLARGKRGFHVDMTPPALEQTQRLIKDVINRLVDKGLLARDGYWHRLLVDDAMPIRGQRILLWSGFLLKPAPGVALRVGPAFNRRSRISVVEHAIVDTTGFTPLVLEIDGRDLGRAPVWIDDEIGCVLPVARHVRMTLRSIRTAPEVVREFESFFDAHYFETKKVKPTGKYRRLVREPAAPPAEIGDARVLYAGPAMHTVTELARFHHPGGIDNRAPAGVSLPQCLVRNVAPLAATWDGQTYTRERKDTAEALRVFSRDWRAAGGRTTGDAYEFISEYAFGPRRDEPYWLLQPWVFTITPPGWSSVVDGMPAGGGDGMRGIIRTDQFHTVSMVYRMYEPGPVVVRKRASILRFFPVPRRLQSAPMMTSAQVI